VCPNLRIRGHLPAPIINGRRDSLLKWPNFQLSRACDLDLGSGHIAYGHASLIDIYLHAKFHWYRRNFLWTDERTDGHLRPTSLGQLRVNLTSDQSNMAKGCINLSPSRQWIYESNLNPHLIYDSLDPQESGPQVASQSIQHCRSVWPRYICSNGTHLMHWLHSIGLIILTIIIIIQ